MTLVTARYGDTQLSWTEEPAAEGGASKPTADPSPPAVRRIVVQLPEALRGSARMIHLGAVAPLPLQGRLPVVRPATEAMHWQEGNATLLISSPLELSELHTRGCRQTKVETLPPPAEGEAVMLQYFRPDADVTIGLRRHADRFAVGTATTIDFRGTTIGGRDVADLTAQQGECFALAADVPASWIIDSVESIPSGGVATWSIEPESAGRLRLDVGLTKALRPDRPVRLVVAGRWRRPPLGATLRSDDLQMVQFHGVKSVRRLVALHAVSPYRLQLSGGENLTRLDPEQLAPADAALLGAAPIGILYVADANAAPLTITVNRETPKYTGSIHLDLQVGDDSLQETYTLQCAPEAAAMDHVLVHFSAVRPAPLQWTISAAGTAPRDGGGDPIVARKLSGAAAARWRLSGGEIWELTWRQPRSGPFEIRATRSVPLGTPAPIALAALVQAASQQGTVEIHAAGEHLPVIANRRLKPAPCPRSRPTAGRPSWRHSNTIRSKRRFNRRPIRCRA